MSHQISAVKRCQGRPCLAPLGHRTKDDNRLRCSNVVIFNYVAGLGDCCKNIGLSRLQRAVVLCCELRAVQMGGSPSGPLRRRQRPHRCTQTLSETYDTYLSMRSWAA